MERKRNELVLGILRLVAGAYLIYLSKELLTGYFKEHSSILFLIGAIFFIGTAIFFIVDGFLMLRKELKERYSAFYAAPEETADQAAEIIETDMDTDAESGSEKPALPTADAPQKKSSPWDYNNAADDEE